MWEVSSRSVMALMEGERMSNCFDVKKFQENGNIANIFEALGYPECCIHDGVQYSMENGAKKKYTLDRFPPNHPAEEFSIPDGVDEIGDDAFKGCRNLKQLIIPASVRYIGEAAFADVAGMTLRFLGHGDISMQYPEFPAFAEDRYEDHSDVHLIVIRCSPMHAWAEMLGLPYTCDDGYQIQQLGGRYDHWPFPQCAVKKFTGTDSQVTVPRNADVAHCYDHGQWALYDGTTATPGVEKLAIVCYEEDAGLISYCIPRITTQICDCAFENCDHLTSVILPDSMKVIGSKAFADCARLEKVFIPASVTQIAPDSFHGCPCVVVQVAEASYAHRYALDNGIAFALT